MKQIPNLFTLLNLVFGCVAILYIFKDGYIARNEVTTITHNLVWGAGFIFLSALVDFLDGFVARLFNATSALGAQLDSLADVVSFGVAPGMIIFQLLNISYTHPAAGGNENIGYLFPAILIPCAAAWRLAVFNLDTEQTYYFKGVPTPAAGLTLASFAFIIYYGNEWMANIILNKYFLYTAIIFISGLMVSQLPLISLKFKNFSLHNNIDKLILLAISIIAIIFLQWAAVPVIFVVYVLVSLAFRPNRR